MAVRNQTKLTTSSLVPGVRLDLERKRLYNKAYYDTHAEKMREYANIYRKSRPEIIKARNRAQYLKNHEERIRRQREYRALNPEKVAGSKKRYYDANTDKIKLQIKAWRDRNPGHWRKYETPEKHRIKVREWQRLHPEVGRRWRANNREKERAKGRRRWARQANAPGTCSIEKWFARVKYYGWRCRYCGKELSSNILTQDHVIPLSKGGTHWPSNLVPACGSCNSSKKDKRVHNGRS